MKKTSVFVKNKLGFLLAVMLAAVVGGATTAVVMAAIPNSQTGEINACYRTQGGLLVRSNQVAQKRNPSSSL